jgi:glycosyltransferase involved in cell wall biosynthesis
MAIIERFSFKRLCKNGLLFTYIDNQLYGELSKIGLKRSNSRLVSNGVDIDKFKPSCDKTFYKNKNDFSNDDIIFLSIGRLTEQKNPFELIDVFSKINNEMKFSYLIFVGKGELSHELQKYVKSLNLQNNIHFFGYVTLAELLDIYSMSDYYIMSSKYEGQPLTLLEAMASGLPCIVSDIPNLRIVEDANCGIVVDFSDHEKAAHEIIDYINQDNSEHGKNARKYAEEYLDWGIIAEKYLIEFKNKGIN